MEISIVRKRIVDTIGAARRAAALRRERADQAGHEYERFLAQIAIPLFRQAASVLRAEGYAFTVFTPGGSVRLMSDRAAQDYLELVLDTAGAEPAVLGRTSHLRGRHVLESERPLGPGNPGHIGEDDVLAFLASELAPFVER